jgi:2-iminobutanoate/2-iminopropanoate deaminase
MTLTRIQTENAPAAIGPYSQGITLDNFVFCSGQVGLDPATGELVSGELADQVRRALTNLKGVLEAGGSNFDYVLKTTVFLVDINDFKAMNEIYAEFFTGTPPARSTVAVRDLPKGAKFEIECIAVKR